MKPLLDGETRYRQGEVDDGERTSTKTEREREREREREKQMEE